MGNITFTMIKPDAVQAGHTGKILDIIIQAGYQIKAMKMVHLTKTQAESFYGIHRERGFFGDLVKFMISGPIVAAILEKDNAVADFRTLIGATDPQKADKGTIRQQFATSIDANAMHGSDSDENAKIEADFHFSFYERV